MTMHRRFRLEVPPGCPESGFENRNHSLGHHLRWATMHRRFRLEVSPGCAECTQGAFTVKAPWCQLYSTLSISGS